MFATTCTKMSTAMTLRMIPAVRAVPAEMAKNTA